VEVLLGENPINQPLDEQRIEKEHEAAEYDQGHTEEMRTQERSQLPSEPSELRVAIHGQRDSQSFRQNS
jgi:hypothetical protein